MSQLEAQAGIFRLLNEEDFQSLCTLTFGQKDDFLISIAH